MAPTFDAGKPVAVGLGWGCSCQAHKLGEPTPEEAVKALDRAANVTVLFIQNGPDGLEFEAWTDPENRYAVTYGHGRGGWCKHTIACASHWMPCFHQLALGAGELLAENHEQGKEIRKLERRIERLEK